VLEHAVEFVDTLLGAIRPGVTHAAIHDLGVGFLTDRGYAPHGYFEGFFHAFGHQMGLTVEGPFIAADQHDPIVAGQVIAIEIVVGTPATGGISHEDVVIVHPDANEVLTAGCPKRWW
jgi:Xaa-Pro aminopeptidase